MVTVEHHRPLDRVENAGLFASVNFEPEKSGRKGDSLPGMGRACTHISAVIPRTHHLIMPSLAMLQDHMLRKKPKAAVWMF